MNRKIEATVAVIVHSTEDVSRIIQSLADVLGLEPDDITVRHTTGYFGNPITTLNCRLVRRQAAEFVERLTELIPDEQIDTLVGQIPERTADSRFYMRLDKQELVRGAVSVSDDGAVKIGIQTPIYRRNDTVRIFSEILGRRLP